MCGFRAGKGTISVLMIAEIGQDYDRGERASLIQFIYSRLTPARPPSPALIPVVPGQRQIKGEITVNIFYQVISYKPNLLQCMMHEVQHF